jgi:hypothetical protein
MRSEIIQIVAYYKYEGFQQLMFIILRKNHFLFIIIF